LPADGHDLHGHAGVESGSQAPLNAAQADPGDMPHTTSPGEEGHTGYLVHADHTGHERVFRKRFWVCLVLSIPVLLYSESIQGWFGFTMPAFPGSHWITPLFAVIVFIYGGLPFLRMAVPELQNRSPGMMNLISLAISVAFVYSLAALFATGGETFFWELVTLIDIMLLGHWLEMRSVRQASGALDELARLMPDTAERILPDGAPRPSPSVNCKRGASFWCARGPASRPMER
jgi:Cu2+-exporting ATPase